MNIEEKAKAYDVALKIAKIASNDTDRHVKAVIKRIFPTLDDDRDREARTQLINICNEWLNGGYNARPCLNDVMWLKNLLERQEDQKSKENSPLCSTIKDKIDEYIANHFIADTIVKTDIKSIVKAMEEGVRLGKESQKPAEWSEEDKKVMSCIGLALTNVDEQSFKNFGTTLKNCLSWLKNLRPSWKPSEEQMEELRNVAAIIAGNKPLIDLYEQLRKL